MFETIPRCMWRPPRCFVGHLLLRLPSFLPSPSRPPSPSFSSNLVLSYLDVFCLHFSLLLLLVAAAAVGCLLRLAACRWSAVAPSLISWNEPSDPDGPDGPNARFKKAMSLTGGELCRYVQGLAGSWWPGRAIVAESLARRKKDHPSGEVRFVRLRLRLRLRFGLRLR